MSFNIERKFFTNTEYTWSLDCHPTEPWLLTSSAFGNIQIYNPESSKVIHSFYLGRIGIRCVKFIARKNWYVVGSDDGKLRIFNCTTHGEIVTIQACDNSIYYLAVHFASPIILTADCNGIIKAWDWDKQWKNIRTYHGHTERIRSIAFNPKDPNTFASASHDGTIKMWSIATPKLLFTINAHDGFVKCVDFHPDEPYLVSASTDRTVKVWNYHSRTCVQTLEGHTDRVNLAVFHPSLPIIISGSDDGIIKIWNNKSYDIEATLNGGLGWASSIALRTGTSQIAVGFEKGVVILDITHSITLPMAAADGQLSSVASNLEGQDMNKPTMSIKTDPEHDIKLALSLDGLTIAYDTALSPSQPSPTLSQSHKVVPYEQCIALAMELISSKTTNKLISELRGDKAQHVADFLGKMVSNEGTFTLRNRKHSLHLLSKLAKSAQVFPRSLELEGVQCNLLTVVAVGGYGFIYKAELEGRPVCVKAVHVGPQGIDRNKMRAQASELTIWANLDHPNVLPFLGIYLSKEEVPRICIVSPWMVNGDLLQYVEKVPDAPRKPLVRDIISGLQYLHDLDIIHADLKAKNVLVAESGKAMLADFGISRLSITLTTILTNAGTGSAYWMAPELQLDEEPRPSCESDIWAFACTCYEIITGMIPFGQYHNPAILVGAFFRGKMTPAKPTPGVGWDEDVWSIAMRCWKREPESRPKAPELLDMINSFSFSDDRPSNSESQRSRSSVEIDCDRILGILNEIRESGAV